MQDYILSIKRATSEWKVVESIPTILPVILALRISTLFGNRRSLALFLLMQMGVLLMVPQWHWDLEYHWQKIYGNTNRFIQASFLGLCVFSFCSSEYSIFFHLVETVSFCHYWAEICFHVLWKCKAIWRE